MPSFSSVVASVTSLVAVSSAAAISSGSKSLVGRQHPTDCGHGTWWYDCANGYKGCYGYDVCSLPPVANNPTTLVTMTTSVAAPTSTPWTHGNSKATSTTTGPNVSPTIHMCPPAGKVTKVFVPTMYDLSPDAPDTAKPPHTYLEIRNQTGFTQQAQVAVFRNVPSTAKSCILTWNTAALITENPVTGTDFTRHLLTDSNAALRVFQIKTDIPVDNSKFTYNEVRETLTASGVKLFDQATFDAATRDYSNPELTFWDTIPTKTSFDFAKVDCSKDIAVYIELDINSDFSRGEGRLVQKQDFMNGISLDFSC